MANADPVIRIRLDASLVDQFREEIEALLADDPRRRREFGEGYEQLGREGALFDTLPADLQSGRVQYILPSARLLELLRACRLRHRLDLPTGEVADP